MLEDEAKVLKEEVDHVSKRKVALEERKKKLTEESYQAERLRSMIDSLSEMSKVPSAGNVGGGGEAERQPGHRFR